MYYYERKNEIFQFLLQKGCCLRCCLRFSAVNPTKLFTLPDIFRDPELTSKEIDFLTDDDLVKLNPSKPCLICLGILQDEVIQKSIEKVQTAYESNYKGINLFTCALTIPVSIFLKERAIQIMVINEFKIENDDMQTYRKSIQSVKDIWRWCSYPKLQKVLDIKAGYAACNGTSNCIGCVKCIPSLIFDISFFYTNDDEDCKCFVDNFKCPNKNSKKSRVTYSRKVIENILNDISNNKFEETPLMDLKVPECYVEIDKVQCSHDSIFIGGRYTKLSRKVCQTPWYINGEKKMETSVQEIIFNGIVKYISIDSIKFLSSGREDVDVRMLNSGRPFAVELVNPKTAKISDVMLSNIVSSVNESKDVQIVSRMRVLNRDDLKKLKEGENEKTKNYRALCIYKSKPYNLDLLEKLNNMQPFEIVQKTPMRVLHRRPLALRNRIIHKIHAQTMRDFGAEIPSNYSQLTQDLDDLFIIDVCTQAGTYIKEFVHSDFGRTKPSLCDLLEADVDIVALDVTSINLDWP